MLRLLRGDDDGDEEALALQLRDDLRAAVGVLGEVGDDEVELFEVFARDGLGAVGGGHDLVSQLAQSVGQDRAQLGVPFNDENPSSVHPQTFCRKP